jgi:hypothetical protein
MKVQDSKMVLNGTPNVREIVGDLEILSDDGRVLYSLRLLPGGVLAVSCGGFCKHEDVVLGDALSIAPRYSNLVNVSRGPYEG